MSCNLNDIPSIYVLIICKLFSGEMKRQITKALMKISDTRLWGERIAKFGILHFAPNSRDAYQVERDIQEAVKNTGLGIRYY